MDGIDPPSGITDKCLSGGGGIDATDGAAVEIEIKDGVVGAEAERGIGDRGGDIGSVAWGGRCGGGLGEDGDDGGEKEESDGGEGSIHDVGGRNS